MISEELKNQVLNLPIGRQIDIKPKLSTYYIYRSSEDNFVIDNTICGWLSCCVNFNKMKEVLEDPEKFYELNWE